MIENEVNVLLTNEGEISGFNKLKELGYSLYHFPMIRTEPNPNAEPFKVETYDYFIFTSKNSVRHFFSFPFVNSEFLDKKVICIGKKTEGKINEYGLASAYTAKRSYSYTLYNELEENGLINSKKVILVQGNLSKNILSENLKKFCDLTKFVAYNTVLIDSKNDKLVELINSKNLHAVFTSPSGFESFEKLYDTNLVKIISIGESTSGYIRDCGFSPIITSKMQSYDGVADSIISHFNSKE